MSCSPLQSFWSTHLIITMSCCKRAYVAGEWLQLVSNLLGECSVNCYKKYFWWLSELWLTALLCFIFLISSITKAEDPPTFSSFLHHCFFSSPKGNWISLSLCATCIFPVYPQVILSTNSEQCFLKLCSALPYGMVSVGKIIICELVTKWGKANKKEFKSLVETVFNWKIYFFPEYDPVMGFLNNLDIPCHETCRNLGAWRFFSSIELSWNLLINQRH